MASKVTWIALLMLLSGTALMAQGNYGPYQGQVYPGPGTNPGYTANVIPEGTRFIIRLDDTLDTKKLKPGKSFQAKLSEDLVAPNGATIPANKKIKGHVSSVDRGLHGRLLLSFEQFETRHGWRPLIATVTGVPSEHAVKRETGPEGEIEHRGAEKKRIAEGAIIGAAVGAAAGGATAGPQGAIIGAAAGGALGGSAGLLTDRDLKLNKGTQIELRLDRPLQVPQ